MKSSSNATTGSWAFCVLSRIKLDIAFLGTTGFQNCSGPCIDSFEESEVKDTMINVSNKNIVLLDCSKLQTDVMIQYADCNEIDCLIADCNMNEESLAEISKTT